MADTADYPRRSIMSINDPFHRLESKVDELTDAVTKLVLFEERQSVQAAAITSLTTRVESTERKLDMWVNRGIGVWAFAVSAFTLFKSFYHQS